MTGRDNKKSKGRRNLYSHSKSSSSSGHNHNYVKGHSGSSITSTMSASGSPSVTPFQPFGNGITMNVCDVTTEFGSIKSTLPKNIPAPVPTIRSADSSDDTETVVMNEQKITELMDAPVNINIPAHTVGRGQNPYMDRCMNCNTPRTDSIDGDEGLELLDLQLDGNTMISNSPSNSQSYSSLKFEIWTCSKCRKFSGNFQSILEANLPTTFDVPAFLHEKGECMDSVTCEKCIEERTIHERETQELQENWVELRSIVKELYSSDKEPELTDEQGDKLKFLVDKLCSRDPHQLFLRLESQVRELVIGIKTSLLEKLKREGYTTPELALNFTSSMLSHYDLLTKKAHLLAQYLGGLSEHLCRFKVTWELLNKHLFQSFVHIDPIINNSGPTILEQLRQGSIQNERSKDDPYYLVRQRLIKFQEQMSVVVIVWRDCQQLIENYCQEEVKNTQKQVQILKEHLIKEPLMNEALMRNLMPGLPTHKSSTERVLCELCKRERCTCDECTITHMITCGYINSDKGEIPQPPNSFNFALDHTRNVVMDITPPSMGSSTTSSSGSVSPILEDKLTTFYDNEKEEFSDALLNCNVQDGQHLRYNGEYNTDDIDDNAGDDEDEDDDDDEDDFLPDSQDAGCDEPHALQFQPRLDPELSRQLDAELAKSGLLPGGLESDGDQINDVTDTLSSGDSNGPSVFAACQCHACLKQSGHMISTSLPLQVPVSPPTTKLHLYSHIYGDGLPQQHQQRFMFDLPAPVLPSVNLSGMQDHIYHAYSDWDNSMQPRPGSLAAQHHHQHHQRLSALTSDLLPPAPLTAPTPPFSFDALTLASHLATQTTQTSTTSTASAFKSMAGKHLSSNLFPTLGHLTEGSSVDPTKPLDLAALAQKLPQSCLNVANTPSLSFSVPSSFTSPSSLITTSTSTLSVSSKSSGSSHGPPCSRPSPLGGNAVNSKWEKGQHPPHCKKLNSGFLKQPVSSNGPPSSHAPHSVAIPPFTNSLPHSASSPLSTSQGLNNPCNSPSSGVSSGGQKEDVFKNLRSNLPCAHVSQSHKPAASNGSPSVTLSGSTTAQSTLPHQSLQNMPVACSNANSLPSVVNNIGVGTSLPCSDPSHEGHHHHHHHQDDNCDSVDDSCSEKSSSNSTSNQKEGKYCDCCYCEFFGHNNAQSAKTSTNYAEMKDRLRKKLKKRNESKHKGGSPKNVIEDNEDEEESKKDPLEKKGLEGLLSFINGTDEQNQEQSKKDREFSAKAAKRARQKQKKLEEKARQEKSNSPCEKRREPYHLLYNHTCKLETDFQSTTGKQKSSKLLVEGKKSDDQMENTAPESTKSQEIPRSSLIIESTRATISRSHKELDKLISSQQHLNHKRPSMMQILKNFQGNTSVNPVPAKDFSTTVKCDTVPSPATNKQLRVVLQPKQKKSSQLPNTQNGKIANEKMISNGKVSTSSNTSIQSNTQVNGKVSHESPSKSSQSSSLTNGSVKLNASSSSQSSKVVSSVTATTTKTNTSDSPSAGSSSSASQSPTCGSKVEDMVKPAGKAKKNKKKNKNGDLSCVDEIFMPKPENELEGIVDEFDRELEEFKRFCLDTQKPRERRKIPVNVNLKDIFKKKTGLV